MTTSRGAAGTLPAGRARSPRGSVEPGAIVAIAIVAGLAFGALPELAVHPLGPAGFGERSTDGPIGCGFGAGWGVEDLSPLLGHAFDPGSIQSWGGNGSDLFIGGNGYFSNVAPSNWSDPVLLRLALGTGGSPAQNVTSEFLPYFAGGSFFGQVWNGSSWLFTGFSEDDESHQLPALVSLTAGRVTDLSGRIAGVFAGGGIWGAAWNGSAFLLGGQSAQGPALAVLWANGTIENLTAEIPGRLSAGWIQLLAWNGTGWIVGGYGALGRLSGTHYQDLWSKAPFAEGGAYAAAWNGRSWLVGGSPTEVVVLSGDRFGPPVAIGSAFNAWVSSILPIDGGWILAGGGTVSPAPGTGGLPHDTPELALLSDSGCSVDLSGLLPPAFLGGYVQFAEPSTGSIPGSTYSGGWLLVGEGGSDPTSQTSRGAIGLLIDAPSP